MALTDALKPSAKSSAWEKLPLVPVAELCGSITAAEYHDWAARHGVDLHLDWRGRLVITQPDALRVARELEEASRADLERQEKQQREERTERLKWQRRYQDTYREAWLKGARKDGGLSGGTSFSTARDAAQEFLERKVPQYLRHQLAPPQYVMGGVPMTGAELYPGEE